MKHILSILTIIFLSSSVCANEISVVDEYNQKQKEFLIKKEETLKRKKQEKYIQEKIAKEQIEKEKQRQKQDLENLTIDQKNAVKIMLKNNTAADNKDILEKNK